MLCSVLTKRTLLNRSAGLLGFFDAKGTDTTRVVSTCAWVGVVAYNATTTNVALTTLLRYRPELRKTSVPQKRQGPKDKLTRNMEYTPATHTASRMTAMGLVNRRGEI